MKHLRGMLAAVLLEAGVCFAQAGDAESEKRRQEMEATRQAAEAARRAEDKSLQEQPRLQHPIDRYPRSESDNRRAPPAAPEKRSTSAATMFARATELERGGKGPEAVKMYMRAAREGYGKAAARLGEIYSTGIPGVARDYANSLRWYNAARAMGENVPRDAETEKFRQEAEARKREAEARQRAEMERQQPRLMQPLYRYPSPSNSDQTFAEAAQLEQVGKGAEAVKRYVVAARNGSGKAALRLAQIYEKGIPGVMRDYAEQLKWEHVARTLGEDVPPRKSP